ncbi:MULTISPECIES: VTC domain-containing protein [unclassified Candidatus Paralachnospira]|uniref:VTC domain-containing protein n=1 Tax=unclassified Candidatus Paralachnospira TaxID=3099471 RepID=UPI003F93CDC6
MSLLPPDTFLMEVKITGAAPLWLANALTSLSIKPVSFSKYGTMYKTMICTKSEIQRVG